jgi:regulator of sigma E protease
VQIGLFVAILGLGLIIFVHELGHFISGKILKLKITEFFLGFPVGPPLVRVRRGETEYGVKPVLFGGYVKFPEYVSLNDTQVDAIAVDGPGDRAGIVEGDKILAIDGIKTNDWRQIFGAISNQPGRTVNILLLRNGEKITLPVELGDESDRGSIGLGPTATDEITIDDLPDTIDGQSLARKSLVVAAGPLMNIALAVVILTGALMIGFAEPTNIIGLVKSGSPAEKAGLKKGDTIVSIAGEDTPDWANVAQVIQDHTGERVKIEIRRDSSKIAVHAQLRHKQNEALGIGTKLVRNPRPPGEAVVESARFSYQATGLVLGVMGRLVTSPAKTVGQIRSPIGVVQETAPIAQHDFMQFMVTLAGISIAIGIFNFLPIPPLDGGRIAISAVEFVIRRPIPKESLLMVNAVGVLVLLGLMGYIVVADIFRIAVLK